jgi:F-type H+-transporting ATPase subunit b
LFRRVFAPQWAPRAAAGGAGAATAIPLGGCVLPDVSVFWVIFFVLVLTVILDRLLFKPILEVMRRREDAVRSARELAERAAAEARAASEEFERKTTAARAEIYRQMEEMRRAALAERAEILASTRAEAEAEIAAAGAALQAQADEARRRLEADAEILGAAAADRILGRRAS